MIPLAIALGGALGALARSGVGILVASGGHAVFPWATLTVNVVGCALLGVLMPILIAGSRSPALRAGLTIGFCGGFTTFSTLAYEMVGLSRHGHPLLAVAYVGGSVGLGLCAMVAGLTIGAAVVDRTRSPRMDRAGRDSCLGGRR